MTMTYDDLMYAVLSMAAYNVGNANYHGPSLNQIGTANLTNFSGELPDGFAAVTYNYNGQTVIAYRGTDGNT